MVVHSTKRQALQQTEKKKQVTRDGRVLTAADYYVESLPGLAESDAVKLSMHAGLIPLRHGDSGHLFFWMFDALKPIPPPHHRKLIFWFNGGPGCSSMTGLFLEHGPLKVERTLDHVTLSLNPYSWNRHATMVFLDQPIGTGYAMESGNATVQSLNMGKIVDGFVDFLEGFMGVWPELRAYEMVLAGESFAGVYIPYFADALLKKLDQPGSVKAPKYNLKGLMIGNGMMDPLRQYTSYIDYALEKQIIGSPYLEKARESEAICREYLEKTEHLRFKTCHDILTIILDYSKKDELPCRNRYDVRLRDPDGETGHCGLSAWPPRLLDLTEYMSREDVRTAVHADKRGDEGKGKPWLECNLGTVTALADDASQPSYKLLPDILSRIPVTLFTGDQDLVCNVIGVSRMIKNLKWNGGQGMEASPLQNWFILNDVHSNKDVRKQNIGTVQTRSNLTNIVVFGASHMASVDFPYITRALVERVVLGLGTLDETSLIKEIGVDSNNEDGFVSMLEVARAEIAPVSVWAMMLYIVLIFAVMALAIYALLVVGSKLGFLGEIPIPSVEPILRKLLSFVKTTRQPNEWHELSENEYEDIFHQEDLGQVPDQSTSSGFNFRHTRENQLREAQLERERNARLT